MGYFLLGYNLVQFFAWSTLFLASAATGTLAYQQAYISTLLKFVQVSMMVEVIYIKVFRSLLKISKSPLGPTAVQVIGRIWFIYGIMDVVPNVKAL